MESSDEVAKGERKEKEKKNEKIFRLLFFYKQKTKTPRFLSVGTTTTVPKEGRKNLFLERDSGKKRRGKTKTLPRQREHASEVKT